MFWILFGMLCWFTATGVILIMASNEFRDAVDFFDFLLGAVLAVIGLASMSGWSVVLYEILTTETT